MKTKSYRTSEERLILIGMISSDTVLTKIASKIPPKPFRSKWSNLVARWCILHHRKYGVAPKEAIEVIYQDWSATSPDEETAELVEKFLQGLDGEYRQRGKELNEDFVIDQAAAFFEEVSLERLATGVSADLAARRLEDARARVTSHSSINLSTDSMVDVLDDEEAIEEAMALDEGESIVRYPGALGEFFGRQLSRDALIAFQAPEKRGKTFWLIDMAWRSIQSKRKTVFYSAGDMTKKQMMRRFLRRAALRPLEVGEVRWPKGVTRDGDEFSLQRRKKRWDTKLSVSEAKKAMARIKAKTASNVSLLKMRCVPAGTLSASDIRADLLELVRGGFEPDCIVVDYADILAPEPGFSSQDQRHQINATWITLRRITQEFHLLGVTATQASAESYDAKIITKRHFSNDKRKAAHVTGMAGINQTEEEKLNGLYRLNWIFLREGDFSESRCVTAAGCLELAHPTLASCW